MTTIENLIPLLPSEEDLAAISTVMEYRATLGRELLSKLNRSGCLDEKLLKNTGLQSYARCYIPPCDNDDVWLSSYYDNLLPFCYEPRDEFTIPATLFMFRIDPKLCSFLNMETLRAENLPSFLVKKIEKRACGDDYAELYVDFYSHAFEEGRSLVLCLVADNGDLEYYLPTVISNHRITKNGVLAVLSRGLRPSRRK
jgi:hypothetical protein